MLRSQSLRSVHQDRVTQDAAALTRDLLDWIMAGPPATPAAPSETPSAAATPRRNSLSRPRNSVQLRGSTTGELRAFMRAEAERWQRVAREIGLQPQ